MVRLCPPGSGTSPSGLAVFWLTPLLQGAIDYTLAHTGRVFDLAKQQYIKPEADGEEDYETGI